MRRILCLNMPYLAIERVRRDEAWMDERRPLVLTRPKGAALVVERVCPRGQRRGLRPGQSFAQAQALAPELVAVPHDPQRDRLLLQHLARWALRFSPTVEPVEPDTLLLDITGCQRLFRGEENLARQVVAGLERLGFTPRAAIADTVGAARALAVAGPHYADSQSFERGPDAPGPRAATPDVRVAPPGQTCDFISPLPPAVLRLAPQVCARLETLGLRCIGDLLRLPRSTLPARFGQQLVLRIEQALGQRPEPVTPYAPEEAPLARLSFEAPVADWQVLVFSAEQLLTELAGLLRQREAALRRLECVVCFEHAQPLVLSIRLARAARDLRHVAALLRQRLEHTDRTPGITGLMLVGRETSRWHGAQADLFTPREPGDDEALGDLLDRLANRLGHGSLLRPQLLDDHQPEMAFRYVTAAEAGCEPDRLGSAAAGTALADVAPAATPRPVRLLSRPILVRVLALTPDGPPTWFAWGGREFALSAALGPERLETAWWRGPDIRRDYFRVTADSGEQFWLFRAADEGRWYLHGIFG